MLCTILPKKLQRRGFKPMAIENRDLVILGSGPGGYVASIRASQLGRKVTLVERESLGGVCLNWGCIPTKALLKSAQVYSQLLSAREYGLEALSVSIDFERVIARSREVASKLSQGVSFLMKKNKVEVTQGQGVMDGGNKLVVSDPSGGKSTYQYKDIIIATGARARLLPGVEADGRIIHTYRTILDNRKQPKKMLIIGAGAIGVEFAYFFHTLGTEVTLVEMLDHVLPLEDTDISEALRRSFTRRGMKVLTGTAVDNIAPDGDKVSATLTVKGKEEPWSGDCCLLAVGVAGNVENIGLEKAGIQLKRGYIDVDGFMRTNVPHHYAIGDVAGPPWLAHVASHEGIVAAEHMCGLQRHEMNYNNIPGCTYCQPQVASLGLTEKAAKEKGLKIRVAKLPFSAIGKAIATGESEGMVKVIIDDDVGEVLGVHILHAEATELISEAAVIRSHEGIAASVVETIHPHPTLSEAIMEAMALALGRPINS
jgi:dihydrolipoamide dehydrogenase